MKLAREADEKTIPISQYTRLWSLRFARDCAVALARTIPSTGLARLVINGDDIGDEGCMAIAAALLDRRTVLEDLDLWEAGVTEAGGAALAGALFRDGASGKGSVLKRLSLYGNSLRDAGAAAIGEALGYNTRLEVVDLGGNAIGSTGAEAVAQGIHKNAMVRRPTITHAVHGHH